MGYDNTVTAAQVVNLPDNMPTFFSNIKSLKALANEYLLVMGLLDPETKHASLEDAARNYMQVRVTLEGNAKEDEQRIAELNEDLGNADAENDALEAKHNDALLAMDIVTEAAVQTLRTMQYVHDKELAEAAARIAALRISKRQAEHQASEQVQALQAQLKELQQAYWNLSSYAADLEMGVAQ